MYIEGDVPNVVTSSGNNNNGGWGDWSWIVGLAIIGALFGGRNGGLFGGGNGGGGDCASLQLGRLATTNDVASGFSTSEIMSDLNDILLGQAQMQNFINQGFAGVNQTVTNGFAGVNNAICTLGYQNAQLVNGLSRELADCCCKTERAIDGVNYNMATNTCAIQTSLANATRDIIDSQRCGTDRIIGYLTSEKISALQAENSALKGQISNDRQSNYITDTILNRLSPCPSPSYIVPNPNCCYQYNISGVGYGNNGGCGCGNF